MKISRVSKRYAKALFDEGKEKNKLDSLKDNLEELAKVYQGSDEFRSLINSPVIPEKLKKQSFTDAFRQKLDPLTFDFVLLLIESSREELLPEIINYFGQILDDYHGILRAQVFSVLPLSDDQMKSLKNKLDKMTQKNVILTQEKDASILGGFIIKINDRIIDASLKNQLDRMSEYLINTH